MKSIKIKRFGKLIPVNQDGNYLDDGFHNAPEANGFYCFNYKHYEGFLVGERIYNRDLYFGEIVGGYIWVHLKPKSNMIIKQVNDWYKIRYEDYHKIYTKNYGNSVFNYNTQIPYARDHLEIFCTDETIIKNVRKGFNKYKNRGAEKSSEIEDINSDREYEKYVYYKEFNKNVVNE